MIRSVKKLALPVVLLLIVGFVLFVINQISGVYLLVRTNSVLAANILLAGLILLSIILIAWPVILYLKLPKPLKLPDNESQLTDYRKRLVKRLQSNRYLKDSNLIPAKAENLSDALEHLDTKANAIIKQTANAVFLTTAVSQNGKLDALTILATQSRMVWKIAHVYYQRPTLRELAFLYANVGASSLLASEIEDMDVSQQIEPVIRSFFKNSAGKSIPVIGPTANIILDSMLEGSTNAFLTLRVGVIARRYCGCNDVITKKSLRKNAFIEASKLLREIVTQSSGQLVNSLLKATRQAGVDTLKSGWEGIKNAGDKVTTGLSEASKKINPFGKRKVTGESD